MSNYILLNKDTPFLSFCSVRNEFDEPEFFEIEWFSPLRPIGYKRLGSFLEGRKAPKHRRHIQELLARYGCDDLEGFLNVTHALSLNDTFWVKRADSDLTWEDVSLYKNPFNELVSLAAFDGVFSESSLSSTSPEFGTDGYYAKCWVREGDGVWLYKTGSGMYEIEPVSEFLATQLAEIICPNSVRYGLGVYRGKLISKCKLFTSEQFGLVKASAMFGGEKTLPELMRGFAEIGGEEDFRRMCILDSLTFNHDRHYGNFGALVNADTFGPIGMAPVYDNNRSLFPELDEDQLGNPDWYLTRCKPRLGRDFVTNARVLMTPEIRAELQNLRGFRFCGHGEIEISERRLDLLSDLVNRQIKAILD